VTGRALRASAVLITLGSVAVLGGCSSNDSVFGGDGNPQAAVAPQSQKAKLAFVPLVGAPANVSAQLTAGLVDEVEKQGIPVARTASEQTDYTVKGYIVAAPEKSGSKLSYIWDVSDKSGQRAHRITGEEFAPGKISGDPWATVDAAVLGRIANATATQLAAWVPTQGGTADPLVAGGATATGAATSVDGSGASAPSLAKGESNLGNSGSGVKTANVQLNAGQGGTLQTGEVVPETGNATTSLNAGSKIVVVPPVEGAPGDGEVSLTKAMRKQLAGQGYQVVEAPVPGAYLVKGKIVMDPPEGGKQKIKITWAVHDPTGQYLNTAKQDPVIPQGSLDGAWGRTADAAAAGAAPKIIKIMQDGRRAAAAN
jgi:hypothetical protein